MSDWTYEMLRYAFSWNTESSEKALNYVVSDRHSTESMLEFQLLDILLLTILTEKDEVERTSALVFLEEHGKSLIYDYTRLHKVYFVLENILGSPVDGQGMTYSLKSHVLVTYTALIIQFDTFETDVARFEGFVGLLYSMVKHTNKSADRLLRAYACECLHELENWHPGLLFPLLGADWSVPPIWASGMTATTQEGFSVGEYTLGKFVNDELLHIQESYARLFFTTMQHYTEQIVQEALKNQPVDEKQDLHELSMAATPATATPSSSRPSTPPLTPRSSGNDSSFRGSSSSGAAAQPGTNVPASKLAESQQGFRFRIPENCHMGPKVAFDLAPEQTPPRLPRKLVRTMTRSIGLVLETMPTSSSWTKIFIAERLSLFVRVLALPQRVVFHHFSPLLRSSRPSLLHAFMVVNALFSKEVDRSVSEAVVDRLFALLQDAAMEPCFRLLAVSWLVALSATKLSTFDLLWARVQELCPRWHDPLELKEMKLQALLYCCKISRILPKNLLMVLESLSEFKYCLRPVGAHAVVFRFLLRVLIDFAPEMDRLEVPQALCDMLQSHVRLLPSVLALNQRVHNEAVQYKLLHSLGQFVARLEPPSRIQRYFGLLVILSEMQWLDPSYVLCALNRLVFCPSLGLTWQAGMRVLITCRRVILSHPQAAIYQPMLRLLQHLATYQSDVDLRDRALLYLRLLTHAGPAQLGALFNPKPGSLQRMTHMLSPVLPKTVRLVNGPVPFLRLLKSPEERWKLGLLDRQSAVFVLPWGLERKETTFHASEWEKRWGDPGLDHQFPKEWLQLAERESASDRAEPPEFSWLLGEYRKHIQASPASIRLPFVLQYQTAADVMSEDNGLLECPRQLFSLELTFSSSEHYVPIEPIRIPFIASEGSAAEQEHGDEGSGFPCLNKLLLSLRPLSPVPTSFGVNIAFNDGLSQMYLGQLEAFEVAFQDLFLPVRLPPIFWAPLFESFWQGSLEESCWSVKVLDLERAKMQDLIRTQLGPFIVPSSVHVEEEDFDFEQEEYFERWNALSEGESGDPPDEEEDVVVHVDTIFTIIFVPPCHHLLMRFAISSRSTIVRILTDRFQLLSYMDAFFLSWSRDAAARAEHPSRSQVQEALQSD
eukprot:TRINITY_DN91987_c0_g1_i1.p1 TRINITY_DN91987_c0_g1~~TRINITY_DN91987_c0_g1_i1.p1  ORF type:complete len:1112 (+),score=164.44 TRINITY_DN91987_c0_g1_i1:116-3451(+)